MSVWTYVLAVIVALLAATGADVMADRKGRTGRWRLFALLFPPAILLLWLLPVLHRAPAGDEKPTTAWCPACRGKVSTLATVCPHCGHPLEVEGATPPRARMVERIAVGVVLVATVGGLYGVLETDSVSGLPQCDSLTAQHEATSLLEGMPLFKLTGIHVVRMRDWTTVASSSTGKRCHAIVTLSNDTTHGLAYRFDTEDGQTMVRAKLDDFGGDP